MIEPMAPRGVARVLYAPKRRFEQIVLAPGQSARFGRDERAGVRLPDAELAGAHFELLFDGEAFHAWRLGSARLTINGQPATAGTVDSGGFVTAGQTTLMLHVEDAAAPTLRGRAGEALFALGPLRDAGQLYALFDAARDPRVLPLLRAAVDEHASLYEGREGAAFDEVAPYLVRFSPESRLLERALASGWGDAFCTFFASRESFGRLRRHWRHFLMVLAEGTGRQLYFRFYDPRVVRQFLPIATPRQRADLFGEAVTALFYEDEDGALARAQAPEARADHAAHP